MIRSPTFSPAAPTKTPPPSFVPPAVKRSTLGPRLPARRWLRNHACRRPSINPSRLSLFHRRQVDGAPAPQCAAAASLTPIDTQSDLQRGARSKHQGKPAQSEDPEVRAEAVVQCRGPFVTAMRGADLRMGR